LRTSSIVIPLARKSKIKETQMRCPLMQGLPKQTLGLMAIRDSNSSLVVRIFLFTCQKGNTESFSHPDNPLGIKILQFSKNEKASPETRLAFIDQVK
jgi:hypothetical protein